MLAKISGPVVVVLLMAACGGQSGSPLEPDADGWVTLVDSDGYYGLSILGDANWRVEDGAVVADSSEEASFLVSDKSYSDFELEVEFWVTQEANSGIFIRCADPAEITDTLCYEANIFDTRPDQTYRTGGIVNVAEPAEIIYTGDQWNEYRITADGPRLMVELNGRAMVDAEDSQLTAGPLALQYGSGTVRFRKARIRELQD